MGLLGTWKLLCLPLEITLPYAGNVGMLRFEARSRGLQGKNFIYIRNYLYFFNFLFFYTHPVTVGLEYLDLEKKVWEEF